MTRRDTDADTGFIPDAPDAETLQTARPEMTENTQSNSAQLPKGDSSMLGGSDVEGAQGEQYIPTTGPVMSNNALTAQARALVVDNPLTHVVNTGMELHTEADLFDAITAASGTTKIKFGKSYTAIKSTTFQAPNGSGTRAGVITRDGVITVLPNGVNYDIWYSEINKQRGYGLVFRFDQRLEEVNPFMQVDIYKRSDLPIGRPVQEMDWD